MFPRHQRGRQACALFLLIALTACQLQPFLSPPEPQPFVSPPIERVLRPAPRVYLPLVAGRKSTPEVWRSWPSPKFGVAGAAIFLSQAGMRAAANLPIFGAASWGARYDHARWASEAGIVYFPRLSLRADFNPVGAPDLDGVVDEPPDLVRCEPRRNQEPEVARLAAGFPGLLYEMFNEPDNLDLLAGDGCIDWTTGGAGYTGFNGDPALTGPRHAFQQAAQVVHAWVTFVRARDPSARFSCCGELNGAAATYVLGVATAYRELYGERIPLDAVSLHIYQVNNWDLASYQQLLRMAIAQVDSHSDLRGLPISLNEGILLTQTMDAASRERSSWLMYHWLDWLGTNQAETARVRFVAWWVDGLCAKEPSANPDWEFCQKQWEITSGTIVWPGTRLFEDKRLERMQLSPAGIIWHNYWCNWLDDERDPVPSPCVMETARGGE